MAPPHLAAEQEVKLEEVIVSVAEDQPCIAPPPSALSVVLALQLWNLQEVTVSEHAVLLPLMKIAPP